MAWKILGGGGVDGLVPVPSGSRDAIRFRRRESSPHTPARFRIRTLCRGPAVANAMESGKPIPICLDTVLRLAQIVWPGPPRACVWMTETDQEWASKHWLPDLSIGMGAARHEGGIQDFQGNLIRSSYGSAIGGLEFSGKYDWKEILYRKVESERRVWQQRGELSKLTSENLLDASTTYVDVLAARTGVAISMETKSLRTCSSKTSWRPSIPA